MSGHGTAVIGEETIRLTSRTGLLQSILERTETVVSGMLRMPTLLLWIMSLAVANTALASIRVRRREIGIMRAVGLSNLGLLRLLLGEAIMIGSSATLLSLAFGIFSGLCAQNGLYLTFLAAWVEFRPALAQILEGALLTLGICLIAALIPPCDIARRATATAQRRHQDFNTDGTRTGHERTDRQNMTSPHHAPRTPHLAPLHPAPALHLHPCSCTPPCPDQNNSALLLIFLDNQDIGGKHSTRRPLSQTGRCQQRIRSKTVASFSVSSECRIGSGGSIRSQASTRL